MADKPKKWLKGAIKHPGALHRQLGVPEGEKIPAAKLEAATHSDNPTLRHRAQLAETMKGFHHGKSRRETLYTHPRSKAHG